MRPPVSRFQSSSKRQSQLLGQLLYRPEAAAATDAVAERVRRESYGGDAEEVLPHVYPYG